VLPLWPSGSPRDRTKQASLDSTWSGPRSPSSTPTPTHTTPPADPLLPDQIYTPILAPIVVLSLHSPSLTYLPSHTGHHHHHSCPPYSRALYTCRHTHPRAPASASSIPRQYRLRRLNGSTGRRGRLPYPETPLRRHMTAVLRRPSRSLQASLFLSLKSRSSTALKTTIL
jgi:hypothetical protein